MRKKLSFVLITGSIPMERPTEVETVASLTTIIAILVLLPIGVVVIESFLALMPRRRRASGQTTERAACVVLIPAHNEEGGISTTLLNLQAQLQAGDRVLVVADNCTDRTAELARSHGAEAIERFDSERRGKGFALHHGVRHLEENPLEYVVILDADCRMDAGALDELITQVARTDRPAQAVYVLEPPQGAEARQQVSAFAWLTKNLIRPLGLWRIGGPCLLTGSGMAFAWRDISRADLDHGNIVEDMQLGIDLALDGREPRLCPTAMVVGEVAPSVAATSAQRTRWEHGHLRTLLTQVPRLVRAGVIRCRPSLLLLALELSVPPLTMLVLFWVIAFGVSLGMAMLGGPVEPVLVLLIGGMVASLVGAVAWARFGQQVLSARALARLPIYILWKLPIYLKFLGHRQRRWIRTERAQEVCLRMDGTMDSDAVPETETSLCSSRS